MLGKEPEVETIPGDSDNGGFVHCQLDELVRTL